MQSIFRLTVYVLALGCAGFAGPSTAAAQPAESLVARAVAAICASDDNLGIATRLGAKLGEQSPVIIRGSRVGTQTIFLLADGARLVIHRIEPQQVLRRLRIEYAEPIEGGVRPRLVAIADPRCQTQTARRIEYDDEGHAAWIERLDGSLEKVEVREPLNPPVPHGRDFTGVLVAMVDAGVNYTLGSIRSRLARADDGALLGYDFWDLDERPFDAHPSRSVFFPQRHGTQTASIVLDESPVASLVPFRYPRDEMVRMSALVARAARLGVRIINISLGSNRKKDWDAFAIAANIHPDMLFVVSAGNNGRDIDAQPVYPASLEIENLITVSSSDPNGLPARGSNWGRVSVDFLIPAEDMLTTDFYGQVKRVSGSSYAAARVSALAACLLGANPSWRAPQLKAALTEIATPPIHDAVRYVAIGTLPDPTTLDRGACRKAPVRPEVVSHRVLDQQDFYDEDGSVHATHELNFTLAVLQESGWEVGTAVKATKQVAQILAPCDIAVRRVRIQELSVPIRLKYFENQSAVELVQQIPLTELTAFLVRDTLQDIPFDGEAIGRSNAKNRESLMNTVWITSAVDAPGIALAHELVHVLSNSGQHVPEVDNLMYARTTGSNTRLTPGQCMRIRKVGLAFGLLKER